MDAPERIWAWTDGEQVGEAKGGEWRNWQSRPDKDAEYVRADIAWNEALEAASKVVDSLGLAIFAEAAASKQTQPEAASDLDNLGSDVCRASRVIRAMKK